MIFQNDKYNSVFVQWMMQLGLSETVDIIYPQYKDHSD